MKSNVHIVQIRGNHTTYQEIIIELQNALIMFNDNNILMYKS